MITTITLNTALDTTYYLSHVKFGCTNRVNKSFVEPGGKGVNVAKILHILGQEITVSGYAAGYNGKKIKHLLSSKNIPHHFVEVEGESRVCLTLMDESSNEETEILETGPVISPQDWDEICVYVEEISKTSKYVVLSGSLPVNCPEDGYAQLINIINKYDSRAILDTSGAPLKQAINNSSPFLIKPNEHEIKELLGKEKVTKEDIIEACQFLHSKGIKNICISLGKDGAMFSTKEKVYHAIPPQIEVINTIGCGDAMVAGLVKGFYDNLTISETLSLAVACGSANALQPFAGLVKVNDVERLKEEVVVNHIR
ncbi:1-phosphofructokinase family hexose kinase [Evansella vedderi]|uniref:Tagatose-6-phosphate kinase n=1 Tax=Evansella vedderi TaxID=38282 RepID=A0ABT9ZNE8_9BACI|nr:1-phosphofructokinase [Evansella vedderi]MDQ0252727.1 1-phosphofructokinase family hexose kinase [Evansella vedderi]